MWWEGGGVKQFKGFVKALEHFLRQNTSAQSELV